MDTQQDTPFQATQKIIAAVANTIAAPRFPAGDRAALRRLTPSAPAGTAYWTLLIEMVPDDMRRGAAAENAWATVLANMAQMAPNIHSKDVKTGAQLFAIGYSEMRLETLLSASGPMFDKLLSGLCRQLSTKGLPVNWAADMAWLILGRGVAADNARRRIARDYFEAKARSDRSGAKAAA